MKFKITNLVEGYLSTLSFLLNPLLGSAFAIRGVGRNSYFSIIIVSLLLSLMAFIMKPYVGWDIVRYYDYYNSGEVRVNTFASYFFDIGTISVIIDFMAYAGIKKEFIPTLSTFIQYFGIFTATHLALRTYLPNNKKINYYFYLLAFFSSSFIASASGVRNGASLGFFILGYYLFFENKKKTSYILFFLASLMHFFVLIPIVLMLTNKIWSMISIKLYKIVLVVTMLFAFIGISNLMITSIFIVMKPLLLAINMYKVDYVIAGQYSAFIAKDLYDIVLRILTLLPLMLISVLIIKIKKTEKEAIFIYQMMILCFLFSGMNTLFNRYSILTELVCAIFMIKKIAVDKYGLKINMLYMLILLALIFSCIKPLGQYRGIYIPSWSQLLTKTTIQMLDSSITPKDYIPAETSSIRGL
ncbi:TPA: EpsG family protein [Klebsiella quasipneumoniae subsp. similipneumoniae]